MPSEKALPAEPGRWQIRFGGMGGQGVVVLGDTLSLAGALAGWHAAASMSYGAQVRGGASSADVILARDPIDYPHLERADVAVILSQEAYDAYVKGDDLPPVVLYEPRTVNVRELPATTRQIAVDATGLAMDTLKDRQGSNFIMLGALLAFTDVLTIEQVFTAVERKLGKRFWDLNKRAIQLGYETFS